MVELRRRQDAFGRLRAALGRCAVGVGEFDRLVGEAHRRFVVRAGPSEAVDRAGVGAHQEPATVDRQPIGFAIDLGRPKRTATARRRERGDLAIAAEGTKLGLMSLHAKGFLLTKARFPTWILVVTSLSNPLITISVFATLLTVFLSVTGRTPSVLHLALFGAYLVAMGIIVIAMKPKAVYGSLNVTKDLAIEGRIRVDSAGQASTVSSALQGQVGQLAMFVDKINVGSDGADVTISAALSESKLKALLGMFGPRKRGP